MRKMALYLAVGLFVAALGIVGGLRLRRSHLRLSAGDTLSVYQAKAQFPALKISYPHDKTLFPPEIAPVTFRWEDDNPMADTWLVSFHFNDAQKDLSFFVGERQWTGDKQQWEEIKKQSVEKPAEVTIIGLKRSSPKRILSAAQITISTSKDPVGAPIFYREVNLPFIDAVKDPSKIRWRFGAISSEQQPPVVLTGLPVCGNCHSFSADGGIVGMDVDYANSKGSYVITQVKEHMVLDSSEIITWDEYKRGDNEQTFGLLSQISPDGRYVVSTVKDRSVFVPRPDLAFSQLFFPIKGILAFYDRQTETFSALGGADDPNFVQSNPSWSPDGKYIVFARSEAYKLKKLKDTQKILLSKEECEEFLREGASFRFDLYRIPFNDGKGGKPEPLEGASDNGMSNYFARYSPDGKWIVFCQAANFMLLQPDSELFIISAEGGPPRRLDCNLGLMNSWHSWSPNSRWLVFSSKDNSFYTQLFLTHIDQQGRSSPAIALSWFTSPDRAANIPEFVNVRPMAIRTIREQFINDVSHRRAGDEFVRANDFIHAEREYRKAIGINPDNYEALNKLGYLLCSFKDEPEEGIRHLSRSVELSPNYAEAHYNLGTALAHSGKLPRALVHLQRALQLDGSNAQAAYNIGVLMDRQGKTDEAIKYLNLAVELEPEDAAAHSRLGKVLFAKGDTGQALSHLQKAVQLDHDFAEAYSNIASVLLQKGKLSQAADHARKAVGLDPKNANTLCKLGMILRLQSRFEESADCLSKALALDKNNANVHYHLGLTLLELGQIDSVMTHLSQAVGLDPTLADAHYNLGIAWALQDQPAKARKHLLQAAQYDSRTVSRLTTLAESYFQAGQPVQAVKIMEQAREIARLGGNTALARQIDEKIQMLRRGQ